MVTEWALSRKSGIRSIVAFSGAKEHFLLAWKDAQDKHLSTECCILYNILAILLALHCFSFPKPVGTTFYSMFKLQHSNKLEYENV